MELALRRYIPFPFGQALDGQYTGVRPTMYQLLADRPLIAQAVAAQAVVAQWLIRQPRLRQMRPNGSSAPAKKPYSVRAASAKPIF